MHDNEIKENVKPEIKTKAYSNENDTISIDQIIQNLLDKKIKTCTGNDSLTIFKECIDYVEKYRKNENDKQKIADFYKNLVEKCLLTSSFRNDERFLDFFFKYAEKYDLNPANCMKKAHAFDFAKKSAAYIIKWSKYFQSIDDYEQEIAVIKLGIIEDAQPLIDLQNLYKIRKQPSKAKFSFNKAPLGNICFFLSDEPGYQFEEIRAETYNKAVNIAKLNEAQKTNEIDRKYVDEINALKMKLAEAEESLSIQQIRKNQRDRKESAASETMKDKSQWLNKTKDSTMSKKKNNYSCLGSTFGPDMTTTNYDNFTNVTAGAFDLTDFTSNGDIMDLSNDSEDENKKTSQESLKLRNFNSQISKLTEDIASRTIPQLPQEPLGLSLTINNFNCTSNSLMEPESFTSKYDNLKSEIYTNKNAHKIPMTHYEIGNNTTIFQDTQLPTSRIYNAMKKIENFAYKKDTTENSASILNKSETSTCSKNTTLMNNKEPDDDFSIFVDNNTLSNKSENVQKPEIQQKSLNDDLGQFYYDQTTVKDLHSKPKTSNNQNQYEKIPLQQRKPLSVISDEDDFSNQHGADEIPNFDLTMTTNVRFEPDCASTRFFKPLSTQQNEMKIDRTTFEKENNEDKETEKNKLLSLHLLENNNKLNEQNENNSAKKTNFWPNNCTLNSSNENCSTKKVKFDTTVDSSKISSKSSTTPNNQWSTTKVGQWDHDFEIFNNMDSTENTSHQEQLISQENDLTKLISPSNKLFKTVKLPISNKNKQNEIIDQDQDKEETNLNYTLTQENDCLTSENLERTFNHEFQKNFYMLCPNFLDNTNPNDFTRNSKSIVLNASKILDISEYHEENNDLKNKTCELEPQPIENTTKLNRESTKIRNILDSLCEPNSRSLLETNEKDQTTNKDMSTTIYDEDSSLSNESNNTKSQMSINSANLNETIVQSIRNPFCFEIKNRLLKRGPLEYLKSKSTYTSLMANAPLIKEKATVFLKGGLSYKVLKEIGKGSYAVIYSIESKNDICALKVDSQTTAWEYYITETLHDRLLQMLEDKLMKINVIDSFIHMKQFMKYNNGCLSVMNFYKHGSLLDLINYHVTKNENFPYWFVLYLTLEMLYILNYLHKSNILHADIKPDNFLINNLPDSINYFNPDKTKCLVLIDFNRSIDLEILPKETEFVAKVENKSLLCCEMKSNKGWSHQIDYYGILYSIHCIIFKKYMNIFPEKETGKFKMTSSFPRSFDKLYNRLFDTYLNVPSSKTQPNLEEDFIKEFVTLFKNELSTSFGKYKQYLAELNSEFIPSLETKAKLKY